MIFNAVVLSVELILTTVNTLFVAPKVIVLFTLKLSSEFSILCPDAEHFFYLLCFIDIKQSK